MFRKKEIKILIIAVIGLLLLPSSAKSADCVKHPIFCQIKKNSKVKNKKAMMLSNIIHKMSTKYDVSSDILTAIFAQESGYGIKAMNCLTGLDKAALDNGKMKEVTVCFDFGIGQINWRNIKKIKIDIVKLMNDYEYSVEIAAQILSGFKKKYAKWDESYWTRYNARNAIKRELYRKLVERYKR